MSTVAIECSDCNRIVAEIENSNRHDIYHEEEVVCRDCFDEAIEEAQGEPVK